MTEINFDGLSLPQAEEVIAEIWSCLDEFSVASPVMQVEFGANAKVALTFTFEDQLGAELVRMRLSHAPVRMASALASRLRPSESAALPQRRPGWEGRASAGLHTLASMPWATVKACTNRFGGQSVNEIRGASQADVYRRRQARWN